MAHIIMTEWPGVRIQRSSLLIIVEVTWRIRVSLPLPELDPAGWVAQNLNLIKSSDIAS